MFFESHAHYDDRKFSKDRDLMIEKAQSEGVKTIINIGANIASSRESIALSEKYPFIYAAVGVHPHDVKELKDGDINVLRDLCKHEKVVAIGEIGLDFYYDNSPRDLQKDWFVKQLNLAEELDLPVVIHAREACADTLNLIKQSGVRKGVIHCFSGSVETALEYVKMGFYIGVGGVVTYSNAKNLVKTVETIPLEKILLETDCPYLPPAPKRGERNDSSNLKFVCDKIAALRGVSALEVAEVTFKNGEELFGV